MSLSDPRINPPVQTILFLSGIFMNVKLFGKVKVPILELSTLLV